MADAGSTKIVLAALGANALIAVSKFVAAAWTGSSAMLSEAIHSLADTGNQGLMLLGLKRAKRPPDERYPFGYSREIYFWSFVVAVLLFSLGAGVSIYEGIEKLRHPHAIADPIINYIVLGVALLFEGGSAFIAIAELKTESRGKGPLTALRDTKDATLVTVVLEDSAAIIGLLIALAGVASSHLLGFQAGDGIASLAIGLLLGGVAAFMARETKGLLIGEAANSTDVARIRDVIAAEAAHGGNVRGLLRLRTMHMGPDDILVAATLDFDDAAPAGSVEAAIARLKAKIRDRVPSAQQVFIEAQQTPAKDVAMAEAAARDAGAATPASRAPAPVRKTYPPTKSRKSKKRRH